MLRRGVGPRHSIRRRTTATSASAIVEGHLHPGIQPEIPMTVSAQPTKRAPVQCEEDDAEKSLAKVLRHQWVENRVQARIGVCQYLKKFLSTGNSKASTTQFDLMYTSRFHFHFYNVFTSSFTSAYLA